MSQPQRKDSSDELLTRLIHRIARSTGAFRSTAQALLNGADEDPMLRRELLHDMEFELGELQRLLENVTQYKALEKGSFILTRRDVLTAPWLRQVIGRWQRALPEKTLAWSIDIPEGLPVIHADVDKIELALNNLLGNAVKHSSSSAFVSVRAWSSDGSLRVRVSSSPSRLMPDDYDRLCEPFYTGEIQGRFPAGLGLGLFVSRRLVEQHGGSLEILRPTPEEDSVGFELAVPAAANEIQAHTNRPREGAGLYAGAASSGRQQAEQNREPKGA